MEQVAWAAIGVLAAGFAGVLAMFLFLLNKMEMGFSQTNIRIDHLATRLEGRIEALSARLDSRIDSLSAQLQAHLEYHQQLG
ncbi:MAG: hypothetical protein ABR505_05745 [Actinomycetota bacterium]